MTSAERTLIDPSENDDEREGTFIAPKDGKLAWLICACSFFTQVFILGILHGYGVFFVEFVRDFNASKAETAWIGSLAYGLSMTFGPVTSMLINNYGYCLIMTIGAIICAVSLLMTSFVTQLSQMFLSFSLLYGIGVSLCTGPTMTITPEYFDKHLSIAVGITVSGSSFGTLIVGPLSQALVDWIGWRNTFRFFIGTCLFVALLNSRIKPREPKTKSKVQKIKHSPARRLMQDLKLWKNRVFVIWVLAIACVMFGFYIPYVHLVAYAVDVGIPPERGALLMLVLGACTAGGRLMFGKIVQLGFLNRLHMHQLSMVVTGTCVMLLPLIKSFFGIVMYVVTVGLVDGCYVVLLPILTTTLVGVENSVLAWGFLVGTASVTFTLGPPIAGAITDATGSYNVAFHCAGVPVICGALILFLIPWAQRTAKSTNVLEVVKDFPLSDSYDNPLRFDADEPLKTDSTETVIENVTVNDAGIVVKNVSTSPIRWSQLDKSTSTSPQWMGFSMDVEDALTKLGDTDKLLTSMLQTTVEKGTPSTGAQVTDRAKITNIQISQAHPAAGIRIGGHIGLTKSQLEGPSFQDSLNSINLRNESSASGAFNLPSFPDPSNPPSYLASHSHLSTESSMRSHVDSPGLPFPTCSQLYNLSSGEGLLAPTPTPSTQQRSRTESENQTTSYPDQTLQAQIEKLSGKLTSPEQCILMKPPNSQIGAEPGKNIKGSPIKSTAIHESVTQSPKTTKITREPGDVSPEKKTNEANQKFEKQAVERTDFDLEMDAFIEERKKTAPNEISGSDFEIISGESNTRQDQTGRHKRRKKSPRDTTSVTSQENGDRCSTSPPGEPDVFAHLFDDNVDTEQ